MNLQRRGFARRRFKQVCHLISALQGTSCLPIPNCRCGLLYTSQMMSRLVLRHSVEPIQIGHHAEFLKLSGSNMQARRECLTHPTARLRLHTRYNWRYNLQLLKLRYLVTLLPMLLLPL